MIGSSLPNVIAEYGQDTRNPLAVASRTGSATPDPLSRRQLHNCYIYRFRRFIAQLRFLQWQGIDDE